MCKKTFSVNFTQFLISVKIILHWVKFDIQCWYQLVISVVFKATKCQLKVDHAKGLQNWSLYLVIYTLATNNKESFQKKTTKNMENSIC